MPLVFIVLGLLFLVVAIRGTQGELFTVLKSELTGSNNWVVWASAIIILGLIGYWRKARPVTDAFIGLIFLVLLIANKGFFAKFNQGIRAPATAQGTPGSVDAASTPSSTATGSSGLMSGLLNGLIPSANAAQSGGSGASSSVGIYSNGVQTGSADASFLTANPGMLGAGQVTGPDIGIGSLLQ